MVGSLYEKLTLANQAEDLSEDESIRFHLLRMLGTRQGAVQALPLYGLPDLNDLSRSKSEIITHACESIAENIEMYEPRLTEPRVSEAPFSNDTPFTMNFLIEAKKITADGKLVDWTWQISTDGNNVRGK
jgi:type VI secretion system lysozyme-related protein